MGGLEFTVIYYQNFFFFCPGVYYYFKIKLKNTPGEDCNYYLLTNNSICLGT